MEKMIFGITGTNRAGKGKVVDFLKKVEGFEHFSASDLITEEIIKRDMPVNRDSMIVVANDLRSEFGAGYIAEELLRRAENSPSNAVVESIRTLGEVEKLRERGAMLLAVDADQKIRYQRSVADGGVKDGISFEKFVEQEQKEWESNDPNKQNLKACINAADFVIENNGTIEELNEKIEKILKIIQNK
ncbi:MAG: AAA family ATPase [Candidatus Shapirobacteria bacterium]